MRTDEEILDKLWQEYREENKEDAPMIYDVYYGQWVEEKYVCLVQDIEKVREKL